MGDIFVGQIRSADPLHNAYRVAPTKDAFRSEKSARPVDTGSSRAYDLDELVLCADTEVGRLIIGRAPSPIIDPEERTVMRDDERQAEVFTETVRNVTQQQPSDRPINYRLKKEEAILPGDIVIRHPDADAHLGMYRDGSVLLSTGGLAALLMSGAGILPGATSDKISLTGTGLRVSILPGLDFEIDLKAVSGATTTETSSETFVGGVSETDRDREKVTLKTVFRGDPDSNTPDLSLEAGRCSDIADWGNAVSKRTMGTRLKRGFKARLGGFMDIELDLENKELRLAMVGDAATSPLRFWINPDEAVLMKGDQFISFNDSGIFLRGKTIGLAGPWTMWSQADLALFRHDYMPETRVDGTDFLSPVCDWKDVPQGSGIKFLKSVFFGANEEPAVLQNFLTQTYSRDLTDLSLHTHNIITPVPGTPTTPATVPPTAIADWSKSGATYSDPTGSAYINDISKILI